MIYRLEYAVGTKYIHTVGDGVVKSISLLDQLRWSSQ